MTTIIELRPDKNLTNLKFEKYQFSANEIPIASEVELKQNIRRLELTSNQNSLLETRLFAFHNHLFKNPYDTSCWFIDENWLIWQFKKDGTLKQRHSVHDFNANVQNLLYNASIAFANDNIVAISDGGDCLKLLLIDIEEHIKVFTLSGAEPGVILDACYINALSTIIIAMCNIKSTDEKKFTNLLLLTYAWKNAENACESLELISKESLKVKGAIEYVYIENSGKYLHSICQDYIKFECPKVEKSTSNKNTSQNTCQKKIPKYSWTQDENSLTVWIKIEKKHKNRVKVHVTPFELSVTINGTVLIQGECQHRLEGNLTTWEYELNIFKIELFKHESGLIWSELFKDETDGEYLPNETLTAEVRSRLTDLYINQTDSKLAGQPCVGFNVEQLEECDLGGKDNLLQRINLVSHENTHLATLGPSNHVLFTYKTTSGQAICLRHDNDGCLWVTGQGNDTNWNIEHYYTFPGFGYVEASKSNKKFCVSPANGSYVAILEHARYIFLYKKPELNAQIGKQWIVDLGTETHPIMGAAATNEYLTILTKNKLYRLHISF